jgi:hypothetical protein
MESYADKSMAGVASSLELSVSNAGLRHTIVTAPKVCKRASDDALVALIPTAVRYMRVHDSMQAVMELNEHLVPSQYCAYQQFLVVMGKAMRLFDEGDGWLYFLKLDRDLRMLQWEKTMDWGTEEGKLEGALHTKYVVEMEVARVSRALPGVPGVSGLPRVAASGSSPSAKAECHAFAKYGKCSKGAGCKYRHACGVCGSSAHGSDQHATAAGSS